MIRRPLPRFLSTLCLAGLSLVFLGGCQTVTSPEHRISQEPELFDSLPKKHQDLVRQGQVDEGMSLKAVYLAWGNPHEVKESSRNGRKLLTWVYYGREAVPVPAQTVGVGFGTGYYGSRCWSGPRYDLGFDYAYRDYVAAKVEFDNERVVFWERNRRR